LADDDPGVDRRVANRTVKRLGAFDLGMPHACLQKPMFKVRRNTCRAMRKGNPQAGRIAGL